jgi:hypothetical protein
MFLLLALACTTNELEVRIVHLIFRDAMAFNMLPNAALFAGDLGCVVILEILAKGQE